MCCFAYSFVYGFSVSTAQAAANVGLHYAIVDKWCENIHQQHCQHSTFGITVIVGAYDYGDSTDQESIDILAVVVRAAVTGSVAMNTAANAKPPSINCS